MNNPVTKKKPILWLSYPFPPAVSAGLFRSIRFVRYLSESGWEPVVYTVKPDSQIVVDEKLNEIVPSNTQIHSGPIWRPDQWKNRLTRAKKRSDGGTNRAPQPPARADSNPTKISRLRVLVRNAKSRIFAQPDPKIWWALPAYRPLLKLIQQTKPVAIFSTAPPHSSHLLGVWLKRRTQLPLILDFRDPWARSPWSEVGSSYLQRVNDRLERKCVKQADAVILNTRNARNEFVEFYSDEPSSKFHTIYNGYDPTMLAQAEKMLNLSRRDPSQPMKICHVGTIYGRREIRPLLSALARLRNSGFNFHFEQVGLVKVDYDVADKVKELGLEENVTITPPVSHQRALQRMADSDVLLLVQPDGKLQVPGKLFEMILFRKPIITLTGEGETNDLVSRYRFGPIASPEDSTEIEKAIQEWIATSTGADPPVGDTDWEGALHDFDGKNQTATLARIITQTL